MQQSLLIEKYLLDLQRVSQELQAPVLDLACGRGRNGLYLLQHDIPVTFADINNEALEHVKLNIGSVNANKQDIAQYWQTDFEQEPILSCNNSHPLHGKLFSAIIVYRYLYRPLFEHIKASIKPGGILIYETFTEQQAQFGRPKNPDYLLKPNELTNIFAGWKILHSFEGVVEPSVTNNVKQAIAQIVAIKPI